MSSGGTLTITIPDFATMSDDEVASHLLTRVRDGRWSALTRDLLARFKTDKLDLNEAWADTWQRWECPCCGRRKCDVARLTSDAVLLCRIDLHHDHLIDYAKQLFREGMVTELPDEQLQRRMRARNTAYPLIQRFTETLICGDCNSADGAMKIALGPDVPTHFSFSPTEIAQFIKPQPNASHAIDVDIGRRLWTQIRLGFEDRVAFVRVLIARVCAGQQDIEVGPHPFGLQRSEAAILYDLARDVAGTRSHLGRVSEGLLARSRATDGNRSTAGRRTRRKVMIPTDADFDALERSNATSRPWTSASDDWRCTTCERSKFEIMRKSNKGAWFASIQYLLDFEQETDPENQVRRAHEHAGSIILRSHQRYSLCHDCRLLVTEASKVAPGSDEHCFRPKDLRELVGTPIPHRQHDVSPAVIRDAIWANSEWIAATRDYWAHHSEALDIYTSVHIRVTRGLDRRDAKTLVFEDYLARHAIADPGYERLNWLLREGARFARVDEHAN